jgi:hypothetical protein
MVAQVACAPALSAAVPIGSLDLGGAGILTRGSYFSWSES